MKVGIQGVKGSYHHLVAQNYFETIELIECMTFDALTRSIVDGKCDIAVMAIENSIAGSILPNYALIDDSNLFITGESYFNINHNLLALWSPPLTDFLKSNLSISCFNLGMSKISVQNILSSIHRL